MTREHAIKVLEGIHGNMALTDLADGDNGFAEEREALEVAIYELKQPKLVRKDLN